jgi:hypothetical protein
MTIQSSYKTIQNYDKVYTGSVASDKCSIAQIDKDIRRGYKIILDGTTYKSGAKLADALKAKSLGETGSRILRHAHQGFYKLLADQEMQIKTKHSMGGERSYEWRDPNRLKNAAPSIHISTDNGKVVMTSHKESSFGYVDLEISESDSDSPEEFGFTEIARFKARTVIDLTNGHVSVHHERIDTIITENFNSSSSSMESSAYSATTSSLSPPPPYSPTSTLSPKSTSSESSDSPTSPTSSESPDSPTTTLPTSPKNPERLHLKNAKTAEDFRRIFKAL